MSSQPLPDGLIDGRFSTMNHPQIPPSHPASEYLESRTAPRDPSRTQLEVGEIVLAISKHQVSHYRRRTYDVFEKRWKVWTEHVACGNGKVQWGSGDGADFLNSDFDVTRERGLPHDTCAMFRELGVIPGHAVTLCRDQRYGRIIDLFDLQENELLWERLRRRAIEISNPIFIGPPTQPIVVPFRNESDLATWEFNMLRLLEQTFSTPGQPARSDRAEQPAMDYRVAKNFQFCDQLRTREELARSGNVRIQFEDPQLARMLEHDLRMRASRLEGGDAKYRFNGFLTPALAGCDEPDFDSLMPTSL